MPHDIKGQALYAFVTLKDGIAESEELKKELAAHVRKEIGAIAVPDKIQFAPGLPKTRSGKIMRRILRKIAENHTDQIGDTTTLADPAWWTRSSKESSKSEAAAGRRMVHTTVDVSLQEAWAKTPNGKKREATHVVRCETEIFRWAERKNTCYKWRRWLN